MRLTERNPNSQRSAERLSALVRRRAAFRLVGARQWTAGKPVSGASACAADRTISVPFVWRLSQSIVEATNRKAGCGRSARPVWMGRDVNSRFLSISSAERFIVPMRAKKIWRRGFPRTMNCPIKENDDPFCLVR